MRPVVARYVRGRTIGCAIISAEPRYSGLVQSFGGAAHNDPGDDPADEYADDDPDEVDATPRRPRGTHP